MPNRVLFVDDEPNVLLAMERHLRKQYEIETACGAEAGLSTLATRGPFAVVVSDLRMPVMDGARFLSCVRQKYPDTVRMMLTGQADLQSAMLAVNEGNIFQFLTKPCQPSVLTRAVDSALEQRRLIMAERELLERTLHGSIDVMTEILSLVNPSAFGRAKRACRHVRFVAQQLNLAGQWQLELAAMLSQIGCVTVPPEVLDKVAANEPLSDVERRVFAARNRVAHDLLKRIPRLERIAEMVAAQESSVYQGSQTDQDRVALGAHLLRTALDFDEHTSRTANPSWAVAEMRREQRYNPVFLNVLATIDADHKDLLLRVADLSPGMIVHSNIYAKNGALLVARGQEITDRTIMRLENFLATNRLDEPIRVVVPKVPARGSQ